MTVHGFVAEARPLSKRAIGVCRHFSLLLVAMLRHKNIPARARCGFGSYFEKGKFIDHWVAEYWNGTRWVMVDAQIDEVQRKLFRVDFDPLDVPRDRFLVAGNAWALCRAGNADPDAFGILDMHGWAFIAGNVVRDVAALNDVVMLPWDVWGIMPHLGATLDEAAFRRFDDVALRTHEPGYMISGICACSMTPWNLASRRWCTTQCCRRWKLSKQPPWPGLTRPPSAPKALKDSRGDAECAEKKKNSASPRLRVDHRGFVSLADARWLGGRVKPGHGELGRPSPMQRTP